MGSELYFRQLLAGVDYATDNQIAQQMVNFTYLIGDRATGTCAVVDPAYDIDSLISVVEADDMTITDALVTHYHADHCGGNMMGFDIEGVEKLIERNGAAVHINADEKEWVQKVTNVGDSDLVTHASGETVSIGSIDIDLIHTPGHTPGSQCFFVDNKLIAGDTLFLEGCGRTDLPGGDPKELYYSLTQRLAQVPNDATLFPGHAYSQAPFASIGDTRNNNVVFRPSSADQFVAMFGSH